jgi:hypothetical protein
MIKKHQRLRVKGAATVTRTLMMCQLLMGRYPNEVGGGRLLSSVRDDAEYWAYRLEDAGLGTYPEGIVASALETLRARGEL